MSKQSKNWALGALFLGAIGYVAGILTAPKSGKETREDVKHAAVAGKQSAEKHLHDLTKEFDALIDQGKGELGLLERKAKKELEELLVSAADMKLKMKDVLSAFKEGSADDPELQKVVDEAESLKKSVKQYIKKQKQDGEK